MTASFSALPQPCSCADPAQLQSVACGRALTIGEHQDRGIRFMQLSSLWQASGRWTRLEVDRARGALSSAAVTGCRRDSDHDTGALAARAQDVRAPAQLRPAATGAVHSAEIFCRARRHEGLGWRTPVSIIVLVTALLGGYVGAGM